MNALIAALALAAFPTYQGSGSSTVTGATGTCTPSFASITPQTGDIIFAVAQSENEAITLSTPNGFTLLGSQQGAGTSATDPSTLLAVYWKVASGGDSAPVFADSGNHTSCAAFLFRGVTLTGAMVNAGGNDSAANDTNINAPGVTTVMDDSLVVVFTAPSRNGSSSAECSGWTNADLANITEQFDSTHTAGLGGGLCMMTGEKATAGSVGATTGTFANTTYEGSITVALAPMSNFDIKMLYSNGISDSTSTSVSVTGVDAAVGDRVVVAATFGQASSGNLPKPTIGSVTGLPWNEDVSRAMSGSTPGFGHAIIWSAVASSTISSQTVTVTCNSTSAKFGSVVVYVVQQAGNVGGTGFIDTNGGTAVPVDVTVNVTATGSILVGTFQGGTSSTLAPRTDSTEDGSEYSDAGSTVGVAAHLASKTSSTGNTTFGFTTTDQWGLAVGIEVLESSSTPALKYPTVIVQ